MPIEESEPVYQDPSDPMFNIIIQCDLCGFHLYYNHLRYKKDPKELKNSVVICSTCTTKIAITDLKALTED